MGKVARAVYLRRPQDAAFTDFTPWADPAGYRAPSASLAGVASTAAILVVNSDGLMPFLPVDGTEVRVDDATPATIFGGWVSGPITEVPGPRVPSFVLYCQPWAARLAESSTGSLNKTGLQDVDRNFVIAAFADALAAAALAVGADPGVDDPIYAANVAAGWSGVQGTAFLYGTDWSYRTLLSVMQDLIKRVPGTSFRIRPDKILEYGVFATPAPIALASWIDADLMPAGKYAVIDADSYEEETLSAGHFNKVRLGGLGAAEDTAYDTVSIGRYGRVMRAPYQNDENIAAADVTRAAYAKLASLGTRRVVRVKSTNELDALEPGMLVPVLVTDVGCLDDEGWAPNVAEVYLGSPLQEPATGYRGELMVQKVTPTRTSPDTQRYEVELGAYVSDFDHALAARIGGSAVG